MGRTYEQRDLVTSPTQHMEMAQLQLTAGLETEVFKILYKTKIGRPREANKHYIFFKPVIITTFDDRYIKVRKITRIDNIR